LWKSRRKKFCGGGRLFIVGLRLPGKPTDPYEASRAKSREKIFKTNDAKSKVRSDWQNFHYSR
jgi:hypothetical protein